MKGIDLHTHISRFLHFFSILMESLSPPPPHKGSTLHRVIAPSYAAYFCIEAPLPRASLQGGDDVEVISHKTNGGKEEGERRKDSYKHIIQTLLDSSLDRSAMPSSYVEVRVVLYGDAPESVICKGVVTALVKSGLPLVSTPCCCCCPCEEGGKEGSGCDSSICIISPTHGLCLSGVLSPDVPYEREVREQRESIASSLLI